MRVRGLKQLSDKLVGEATVILDSKDRTKHTLAQVNCMLAISGDTTEMETSSNIEMGSTNRTNVKDGNGGIMAVIRTLRTYTFFAELRITPNKPSLLCTLPL